MKKDKDVLLAIDIGNTNTVFALFKNNILENSWRCKTDASRSADEYAVFLRQVFDFSKTQWKDINATIISSVVPDADFHIANFCKHYIQCKPIFVDSQNAGITIDLDQPGEVGADRIVNAIAVIEHYQTPAIVIDFGTATTFDVIDSKMVYLGGVIAPGVRLSMEALHQRAAKLPKVSITKPLHAIGKNTTDAMQSGMYWGYVGLIECILEKISQELGAKPFVIATGGLAELYAQSTPTINCVDDNLIMKGLLKIHSTLNNNHP